MSDRIGALEREVADLRTAMGTEAGRPRSALSRRHLVQAVGAGAVGVAAAAWGTPAAPAAAAGGTYVDVKAAGAAGDGSTDDTAAIQNCIDIAAAGGVGTVFFPGGTYIVRDTLRLHSGVTLQGIGNAWSPGATAANARSTIQAGATSGSTPEFNGVVIRNATTPGYNIALRDLVISGDQRSAVSATPAPVVQMSSPVGSSVRGLLVDHCRIQRGERNLELIGVAVSIVRDSSFGGEGRCPGDAIYMDRSPDNHIVCNQITTGWKPDNKDVGHGIHMTGGSQHNVILGNQIFFCQYGIYLPSSWRNVITGNRIDMNAKVGIYAQSHSQAITGNVFHTNGIDAADASGNPLWGYGVELVNVDQAVVGNSFGNRPDGGTPDAPGRQRYGIALHGTPPSDTMVGNVFTDQKVGTVVTL